MLKFAVIAFLAVVAGLTFLTAAHAQVTVTCTPAAGCPASAPPLLSCTTPTNGVVITARDQNGVFPVPDDCPSGSQFAGVTECLRWSYRFSAPATQNVSVAAITVDADLDIIKATRGIVSPSNVGDPSGVTIYSNGASDSSIGQLGVLAKDFRTLKFSSGQPVDGNVWTRTNVGIGTVTALAKVGNSGATSCGIAGPDNIVSGIGVGKAPLTTNQLDTFEDCLINVSVDANGCANDVAVLSGSGPTCQVKLNGQGGKIITPLIDLGDGPQQFTGGICGGRIVNGTNTCINYCPTSGGGCFSICR
jgi:hypothetical protein